MLVFLLQACITTGLLVTGLLLILYLTCLVLIPTVPGIQKYFFHFYWLKYISPGDFAHPQRYGLRYDKVYNGQVQASDGTRLGYWHILPAQAEPVTGAPANGPRSHQAAQAEDGVDCQSQEFEARLTQAPMVILYLHGQGGSRERSNRIAVYKSLQTTIPTAHIIALDYRGYGDSDGLPDNETLVISDAIAIWNYATQHVPASRILIYGHSLGSGIGAQLCRIVEQHGETPLGLCLEGAMASMPQVMFEYRDQPFLKPLRPFPALVDLYSRACVFRFDTGSILPLIQCPILLIHGREDRVIEIKFAYDMFYSLRPGHGPPTAPKHALSPLVEYAKVQAACKSRPIWEEGRLFRWPRPDKSAQMAWFLELDYADHDSAHVYESTQSVLGNFVAEINSS